MARSETSERRRTPRDRDRDRGHERPHDDENERPDDVRDLVEAFDTQRQEEIEGWREQYERWLKRRHDHGDDKDTPPVTPFLLIRYAATDLGVRPIPPNTAFWSSPDIWVESSDPAGNPVAGEANFLHARIFNLGAFQAAPVQVDFYWANPALGLGPANMNLIGTEWVNVPSLWSVDVRCNTAWVPTMANSGHQCAMVNCSNWILDPILLPFQPKLDRHVGQRNLNVVPARAGMRLSYLLQLTNVFPMTIPATVVVRFDRLMLTDAGAKLPLLELGGLAATFGVRERTRPRDLVTMLRRDTPEHRVAQRALALERRKSEEPPPPFWRPSGLTRYWSVSARLREGYGVIDQPDGGGFAGQLLASLDQIRPTAGMADDPRVLLKEVPLEPFSFRMLEVEVEVPDDAREGEFLVTHLEQRVGWLTLGGYAVVVMVTG